MPCGAVPSYIPTPAKFQKQKGLPVVESQYWHRPPAREHCPSVSVRSSLLSLCIATWTAAVQEPTPFLLLLHHLLSALILSNVGEGARPGFWKWWKCSILNDTFKARLVCCDFIQVHDFLRLVNKYR